MATPLYICSGVIDHQGCDTVSIDDKSKKAACWNPKHLRASHIDMEYVWNHIYIIIYLLCINKYIILYTIYIYIISYIIYLLYIIFIFINQFVGTNIYCIIYLNGIIDKNTCLLFYEFPLRSFPQPRHSLKDQNKETSTSSAH